MLSNFIKIPLRDLWRNKFFTFTNVFGLSMGLACCMLLLLYVRSEMAYDGHHQHADDLYLLGTKTKIGTAQQDASAHVSAPFAFALRSE